MIAALAVLGVVLVAVVTLVLMGGELEAVPAERGATFALTLPR